MKKSGTIVVRADVYNPPKLKPTQDDPRRKDWSKTLIDIRNLNHGIHELLNLLNSRHSERISELLRMLPLNNLNNISIFQDKLTTLRDVLEVLLTTSKNEATIKEYSEL